MMPPKQAKITQKLLLRSAVGLFVLTGLVMAFRWYKDRESDPAGDASITGGTVGWITALETSGDGKYVVAIKPEGTVLRQPVLKAENEDRDPVWRPDGNFIFFASNRQNEKFAMFRWKPETPPELRSLPSTIAQGAPFFLSSDADLHSEANALITFGGKVMQYDPKKPAAYQVLPPPDPKSKPRQGEEGGGQVSPFEGIYDRFGSSFKRAKWSPDKKAIYAVMRGEGGEVLIYQRTDFTNPQDGAPRVIAGGERIDFDVDPKQNRVVFAILNFHWVNPEQVPPEFIKDGKITAGGASDDRSQPGRQYMLRRRGGCASRRQDRRGRRQIPWGRQHREEGTIRPANHAERSSNQPAHLG
jgi:hypothetical protein